MSEDRGWHEEDYGHYKLGHDRLPEPRKEKGTACHCFRISKLRSVRCRNWRSGGVEPLFCSPDCATPVIPDSREQLLSEFSIRLSDRHESHFVPLVVCASVQTFERSESKLHPFP